MDDDKRLEAKFGFEFCQFLSHDFVRTHLIKLGDNDCQVGVDQSSQDETRSVRDSTRNALKDTIRDEQEPPRQYQLRKSGLSDSDSNNALELNPLDISNLSLQSRTNYHRINSNKSKNAYSMSEDYEILKFIIDSKRFSEVKGVQLWHDIEEHFQSSGQPDRSWQGLKERFRKNIVKNLKFYQELYGIAESDLQRLKGTEKKIVEANVEKRANLRETKNVNFDKRIDEEILKYILNSNGSLLSNQIWMKISKHLAESNKSIKSNWQSLRDRFLHQIIHHLEQYQTVSNYADAQRLVDKCDAFLDSSQRAKIKRTLKSKFGK